MECGESWTKFHVAHHTICEPVERGDSPNRAVPPLHVRVRSPKTHNNLNHFDDLGILCTNDHEHEPWGQTADGQWATALEVVYPWDLCRAMAGKEALELQDKGVTCAPPCFALQEATLQSLRATTEIQPRRGLPPMVPEFCEVKQHPAADPIPPCSRRLSTPHPGVPIASADKGDSGELVTIGIHRKAEQFIEASLQVGHPTLVHSLFPETMHRVVNHTVTKFMNPLLEKELRN